MSKELTNLLTQLEEARKRVTRCGREHEQTAVNLKVAEEKFDQIAAALGDLLVNSNWNEQVEAAAPELQEG